MKNSATWLFLAGGLGWGDSGKDWSALLSGFLKQAPPPNASWSGSSIRAWPCGLCPVFKGASWEALQCLVLQVDTCSPLVQTVIHSDAISVTHPSLLRLSFLF